MQGRKHIITALGCAAAMLIATTTAWANGNQCHEPYKLGGAWVGTWVGKDSTGADTRISWSHIHAPMDPARRTAAIKIQWHESTADLVGLNQALDFTSSEGVGEMAMVDRDTARYTIIWYGVANEPLRQIRAIYVLNGRWTFKGPNLAQSEETLKIYLTNDGAAMLGVPDADADHDLLPDATAVPIFACSFTGTTHRRVPILP
jgi:hypothetical protein